MMGMLSESGPGDNEPTRVEGRGKFGHDFGVLEFFDDDDDDIDFGAAVVMVADDGAPKAIEDAIAAALASQPPPVVLERKPSRPILAPYSTDVSDNRVLVMAAVAFAIVTVLAAMVFLAM